MYLKLVCFSGDMSFIVKVCVQYFWEDVTLPFVHLPVMSHCSIHVCTRERLFNSSSTCTSPYTYFATTISFLGFYFVT